MILGMAVYRHPSVPWVTVEPLTDGTAIVHDTRTGQRARAYDEQQIHEFAANAASSDGYGAGDAVAAVASRLGFQKCTPCARRQAMLNAMMPNLWRR